MAQQTAIKIRRSATASKIPLTTDLVLGELALNTYDGVLYFKKSPSGVDSIVAVVTLDGTQTLTNKTLTSPTLTTPSTTGLASFTTTTAANAVNITYNPSASTGFALSLTGKDSQGGVGYFDFLKATNTTNGVTNANKYFRLNSTGSLEIINSSYSTLILSLSDAGSLTVTSIVINGTLTDSLGSVGTNNQILSSTGTGTKWVTSSSGSSGTVTTVSVVSTNGFAGTVANSTTTPAITISTSVTGLLKGNGTAISAATAGTDYLAPGSLSITTNAASGGGTLSYSSGVFTFTPPDLTSYLTASNTATLTNKTFDTAGTGNSFKINGTAITANTGSGSNVLATNPTLVTPTLGVASATTINKVTITAPLTGSTLTIADGKTLTISNTLTFTGTDTSSVAFGGGGTVLYTASTLTASNLSGTIPSSVLGNSTLYIGTTGIALNAASGSITSLAVNISGSAANLSGTQTQNYVYAAPSASNGSASFRALVAADIPPVTNVAGGTTGAIHYQSGANATAFLTGNSTTTPQFVTSTGTGSAAQAPTLTSSTGSGNVVLATSPTLTTPTISTPFSSLTAPEMGYTTNSTFYVDNNTLNTTHAGAPFSLINWHDEFAFGKLYPTITYESYNGSVWSTSTLNKQLFAQQQWSGGTVTAADGTTTFGSRWTFTGGAYGGTSYGAGVWLVIGHAWNSGTAPVKQILVESSTNGTTWTTRHSSQYRTIMASVYHRVGDYGGDQYLRVTITWVSGNAINLANMMLLSSRAGDQGFGREFMFPYAWDKDQNITTNGKLTVSSSSGLTLTGATSGTTALVATAIAGTTTLTLPAATDTLVGKATTDTLTNKTISGSSNTLTNIGNSSLTNSSVTIGTTAISLGASSTTLAGLSSVTSTTFVGALTGNASTATTLATARAINNVNFNGSADITITAVNPNALTIGTGLSGTSYTGSAAVTIAIDNTVATLTGTQTLTNKTIASVVLTGTVTANGGVGTSGQVLSSTGTGVQWIDAGGAATAVSYASQTLTTAQQTQARANINAASPDDAYIYSLIF